MRYVPAIAWALFILVICGFSGDKIPNIKLLNQFSADKLIHGFMFFVLVYLLCKAEKNRPDFLMQLRFYFLLDACMFGLLMEYCQTHFFVNRFGEWIDVLANSLGALLAFLIFIFINQKQTT